MRTLTWWRISLLSWWPLIIIMIHAIMLQLSLLVWTILMIIMITTILMLFIFVMNTILITNMLIIIQILITITILHGVWSTVGALIITVLETGCKVMLLLCVLCWWLILRVKHHQTIFIVFLFFKGISCLKLILFVALLSYLVILNVNFWLSTWFWSLSLIWVLCTLNFINIMNCWCFRLLCIR